jgi:predicted peptidase
MAMTSAALSSYGWGAEPPAAGSQQVQQLDRTMRVQLQYLLYLPEAYGERDDWPLLLFLHGAGERGDDLELVKKHGPPKLIAAGESFPMVVVSPQCPADQWWEPWSLAGLLDELVEKYKVDADRIYVSGLSMGGFGTWALAAHQPRRLAAIAPICGGGEPFMTRLYSHLPTWVFHGDQDRVVPLERSQQMVDALQRAGGQVKFTVYPDVGHDSWTQTYADPQFYQWLLKHRRAAP